MGFSRRNGRERRGLRWGTALVLLAIATPTLAQEECVDEPGYRLCFERDWLRYYNQPYPEFDWQSYIRDRTPPQASDYYEEIDTIYRELLERAADDGALQRWSTEILAGMSLLEVRQAIAESAAVQERIHRIYEDVLGRRADASGLATWTRQLIEGATLTEVRREVSQSEEARQQRR